MTPSQMAPVVGITGRAQSGKDTLGSIYQALGYERLAFADRLKEETSRLLIRLGIRSTPVDWSDPEEKAQYRGLLIQLGEGARTADPNVWIRPVERAIDQLVAPVVITDVRYSNEAEMIRSYGGIIIKMLSVHELDIPSESSIDLIEPDFVVCNNSDRNSFNPRSFGPIWYGNRPLQGRAVYISGPMRGIPGFNHAAFNNAERIVRALGAQQVFNPAANDVANGLDFESEDVHNPNIDFMRRALAQDCSWICERADTIVCLPGWEDSKGATAEVALGKALGLSIRSMANLEEEL